MTPTLGNLLYKNALACPEDIKDFQIEGDACITFPRKCMRLEQAYERDTDKGLHANFVFWCPEDFPDNIAVSWDFRPLSNTGLAMFWVSAAGRNGEDLFAKELAPRNGDYPQYFRGDINALHVSYFRRNPSETGFRTCNLRKSHGFHLVCQGADPLPDANNAMPSYRVQIIKSGALFQFSIDGLKLFEWVDDGHTYGPILGGGKIGFRQMAGLIADYSNLEVHQLAPEL